MQNSHVNVVSLTASADSPSRVSVSCTIIYILTVLLKESFSSFSPFILKQTLASGCYPDLIHWLLENSIWTPYNYRTIYKLSFYLEKVISALLFHFCMMKVYLIAYSLVLELLIAQTRLLLRWPVTIDHKILLNDLTIILTNDPHLSAAESFPSFWVILPPRWLSWFVAYHRDQSQSPFRVRLRQIFWFQEAFTEH